MILTWLRESAAQTRDEWVLAAVRRQLANKVRQLEAWDLELDELQRRLPAPEFDRQSFKALNPSAAVYHLLSSVRDLHLPDLIRTLEESVIAASPQAGKEQEAGQATHDPRRPCPTGDERTGNHIRTTFDL